MQPTEELWVPVADHVGYDVSNLGRVRSYQRRGKSPGLAPQPHMLGVTRNHYGYGQVTLAEPRRKRYVHELVAAAFLGPRPEGMDIAHWDGDPFNNRVSNLRYATTAENMADKKRHGTYLTGERLYNSKLTAAQVAEIRARYGPPRKYYRGLETQASLAEEYGVKQQQIHCIVTGKHWKGEAA